MLPATRAVRRRGRGPPHAPTAIDPNDPINVGMVACYLPGISPFSVKTGAPPLLSSENPGVLLNSWGVATSGGLNVSRYALATPAVQPGNALSIYLLGSYNTAGAYIDGAGVSYNTPPTAAWFAPYVGYLVRPYSNGSSTAEFNWNANGTYEFTNVAHTWPNNRVSLLATIAMGGTAYIYAGGVLVKSAAAGTGPIAYGATPYMFIGTGTSGDDAQPTNLVRIWNRQLSAAEALRLDLNPWAGLLSRGDRLLDLLVGVAGGIAVSALAGVPGEFLAAPRRTATLPGEALATIGRTAALPGGSLAAATHPAALPVASLAAAASAALPPLEALAAARHAAPLADAALRACVAGSIGLAGESLSALRTAAAAAPDEFLGAVLLTAVADALLPLEWWAAVAPPSAIVSLRRLLASPGRVRLLSSLGVRRILRSPGRQRSLNNTDK